ncbi:MAG: tetratricopeptide repeat protein [Bacteroidales bacterium]|nr:tetratricopeptide repeat protein [Bacteroidales bacterium]
MSRTQYILLLFGILMLSACGASKTSVVEPKTQSAITDPRQAEKVTAIFIDANKEKLLGNFRQAMTLYQQCLSIDPNHAPSMYEMARLFRMQGNFNEALGFSEKSVEIDPDNKWYNLMLASLYEQSGQVPKAILIFERLQSAKPNEIEFLHQTAMLYLKENRLADAIKVYDKIENITGSDEDILMQKQKLYLMNNEPDKAVAEIEKLIAMYPGESRYYALLSELYLDMDNYPKAIESLEKIRELDPQNPYIHITLAEYYFKTGDRGQAYTELKQGFANPNLDVEIKFQVLFTYYTDEDIHNDYEDQVTELSEILIIAHPTDARPLSLKADLLIREEKYEEARQIFRQVLEIDNSQYFFWETLLRLDAMLQDNEALITESLEAIQLFPLQPLPYQFAGLAYYQLGNYDEAIKMFYAGKDLVVDDDELLVEFYMHLGDSYSKMKQHESSDAAFDQALDLDAENPYVLNNYSYYLSLRKEQLEKAKEMSAKSLEISPGNKHYLDTYGWILYQMGNYEEARVWIEKALENNATEDAVVLEHLGDVYYKLGMKDDALRYWKQALDLGGEITEFLEKKVTDGILYE